MPAQTVWPMAIIADADANACADVGDDAILGANMVALALPSNRPGLRIDYLIHDEEGQLDQLNVSWER